MSSGCAVRPGSASLPLDPCVLPGVCPKDRPGATSAAAVAAEAIAEFFATVHRTCGCPVDADLREERDGLQCVCGAPLIAVEVEKMYAATAKPGRPTKENSRKSAGDSVDRKARESASKAAAQLNVSPRIVQDAEATR